MIVDDKNKLIFIHIPKTGGTSVRHFLKKHGTAGIHKHASVRELQEFNSKKYEEYYKFTIVRNPYDRFLSQFFYFNEKRVDFKKLSFEKIKIYFEYSYVPKAIMGSEGSAIQKGEYAQQLDYICDDQGNIVMDQIVKYENMISDLDILFKKLNMPLSSSDLPVINASFVPSVDRRTLLTDEIKEKIYNFYKRDFEVLGYSKNYPIS